MITIMLKELRDRKLSLIAFAGIIVLMTALYISMFPTIQAQSQSYTQLLNSLPEGYQKAFGVSTNSFTSLEGFLGVELFSLTFPLLIILLALSRAGGAIAAEIDRGTIRTLLSMPISRARIYAAKYSAAIISVLGFILTLYVAIVGIAAINRLDIDVGRVSLACAQSAMFGLSIVSCGFAISALVSDRAKVYALGGALVLVQYLMHVIAGLQSSMGWLNTASLFHYFDGVAIMNGSGVTAISWWVFSCLTLVAGLAGLFAFVRRDIPAR